MITLLLLTNFVIVLADDQRWDALGPVHALSGDAMPKTRALVAGKGMTFMNAFATTPLCAPSRASILTGLYAHNHGVLNNDPAHDVHVFNDSDTLATRLQGAGYQTSLIGKYMNGYFDLSPYVPPGWDDWHVFVEPHYFDYLLNDNGVVHARGHADSDYSTDVLASKAVSFIAGAQEPFFLMLAPFAPHSPAEAPDRHEGEFDALGKWLPPNINEADLSDKPQWLRNVGLIPESARAVIAKTRREQMAAALATDDAVEAIVGALEAKGVLGDTVIIYMSDNGYQWGEHRLYGKNSPYEESARIAMAIRYDALDVAPGTSDKVVANIDIPATILDLAGVSYGANGVSLKPLLTGTAGDWRDALLIEHWQAHPEKFRQDPPDYSAVRTDRYLYSDWGNDLELYDLALDAWELDNGAGDAGNAALMAQLAGRLSGLERQ